MQKNMHNNTNQEQLPPTGGSGSSTEQVRLYPSPPSYDQATAAEQLPGHIHMGNSGPAQSAPYPGNQSGHAYATQHGAPPMVHQPQHQNVVIIQQQTLPLGPEPAYVVCPACHVQKLTRIEYDPSSRTHLMAALLCVLGLWCFVCLPYCAGSCMNANHYCGNCNKFLGTYGNGI